MQNTFITIRVLRALTKHNLFVRKPAFCLACLLVSISMCLAQPKSGIHLPPALNLVEAEAQGKALVTELLAQRPEQNVASTGVMRIRDAEGSERQVPLKFQLAFTASNWTSVYEITGGVLGPRTRLTVIHDDLRPNQCRLEQFSASGGTDGAAKELAADQTMVPFAGSDFWVADLGLEFFHWPKQLLLKKELRRGQSCNVLESINPRPVPGAYLRVVSWLDLDSGGIIHADAYDFHNVLLKQFDPKEFKKVQGQWQLAEMEIRNRQTGTRTSIEFNLGR